MFIFNLRTVVCNQTYLHGMTLSLNEMLTNNPDWSYRLLCHGNPTPEKPHLTVLDFTSYQSLEQIKPDEFELLTNEKGYRLLLLVHADQGKMVGSLMDDYRCSLLNIDEHTFRIRDIVEASLCKRRYISPSIEQSLQRQLSTAEHIHFTSAETKVLEHIKKGKNGIQIAQILFRSQKTISSHKRSIMKKLDVKDDFHLKVKILQCHI